MTFRWPTSSRGLATARGSTGDHRVRWTANTIDSATACLRSIRHGKPRCDAGWSRRRIASIRCNGRLCFGHFKRCQTIAAGGGWRLLAAHIRSNHLHVVVHAKWDPDKVMEDYKAYCTRRLREAGFEPGRRHRWTEGGSKRYLWKCESLLLAIRYVMEEQGEVMEVYGAPLNVRKEFGL